MRISLSLLLLLFLVVPLRAEDEDTLGPTPHTTPAAAMRRAEASGRARTRDAEAAVEADVVGAVTRVRGGGIGFMPLLQHHMAVEHWFLEGPKVAELVAAARRAGGRCFTRLTGELTLLGVFGGEGLEWYGNGLQHGRDWGPVMGYHERVYRFVVADVAWTRTRAQMVAAQQAHAELNKRLEVDMGLLDWAAASKTLTDVIEGTHDAGFDTRGLDKVQDYLRRMLILERDPATWSEEDKTAVAEALVLEPFAPYKELKKGAQAKLIALANSWPEAVRDDLGPKTIAAWKALEYRHQRNKAWPVLRSLELEATQALAARLTEATANVEAAKKRLEALQGTDDYAGMLAILEEVAADQALVLDYALAEGRTKHWVPAARRLADLKAVMDHPAKRESLLTSQIRETIESKTGLPNQHVKPRYNPEVVQRFVPQLTAAERERIETLLLEIARPLRPSEDWQRVLLVAELLSGFGGERTRAYFPTLLRRSARQPQWQREHLQRFAAAVSASGRGG